MTSSSKKKKEKRKDFQKTQLKVGKSKPKASNFTDTSFKAKSIVVQTQSISVNAPTASSQFAHHVSMLRNRSESQRSESLAFLATAIMQGPRNAPLPEPAATLIPKLQALILDDSSKVRQQLLKLLQCLPREDVRGHTDMLLLYLHAAMTTLHSGVRAYSLEIFKWLIDCAGRDVVSCAGGWIKTLTCFQGLLGWQSPTEQQNGWSSHQMPNARPEADRKTTKRQLVALTKFLEVGLGCSRQDLSANGHAKMFFPLRNSQQHILPRRSNTFTHLDLYDTTQDDESQIIEDVADRRRVFVEKFATPFQQGIANAIKEGGELGRTTASLRKVIQDGMAAYAHDEVIV